MNPLLFGLIMFVAAFTKGFAGFGQALVAVPLLATMLGLGVTSPLMSLFALVSNLYLLIRHRAEANWREMWRLSVTSLLAIPIGVWALSEVDERMVLAALGVVLIVYALYALSGPRLPRLANPNLAFGFGFVSGLLGGAYNTAGPPAVIYGTFRQWEPGEFKGTLQAFFMLNSVMVVSNHLLRGNYTADIWRYFLLALPFLAVGTLAGSNLDRYVSPVAFRKAVLALLVVLGVSLIV